MNKELKWFINNIRLIFFLTLTVWVSGIISSTIINIPGYNFIVNIFFSTTCHQNPDKTFILNSGFLPVCSRCFGIYSGAFICSLLVLFQDKKFKLTLHPFILFSSVLLTDVVLVLLNIYRYSQMIAFTTGIFFGSTVFLYILSVFENSFSKYLPGKT